jgi:chromosomal replication initiation ATPase DnaA
MTQERARQAVMLDDRGKPMITGGYVLREIADEFQVPIQDLRSGKREEPLPEARHEAIWRLHRELAMGASDIAQVLNLTPGHVRWVLANGGES